MFSLKGDARIHIWVPSCMVWLIQIGGLTCVNALFGDVLLARSLKFECEWHIFHVHYIDSSFLLFACGNSRCARRSCISWAFGHFISAMFFLLLFVKQAQNALAPHVIFWFAQLFWASLLMLLLECVPSCVGATNFVLSIQQCVALWHNKAQCDVRRMVMFLLNMHVTCLLSLQAWLTTGNARNCERNEELHLWKCFDPRWDKWGRHIFSRWHGHSLPMLRFFFACADKFQWM